MGREHDPVRGQWYQNLEDDDVFQVLSVDEDAELIEIQYVDGDIEEIDYETWQEMDLDLTVEPEGWTASEEEDDEDEDEHLRPHGIMATRIPRKEFFLMERCISRTLVRDIHINH